MTSFGRGAKKLLPWRKSPYAFNIWTIKRYKFFKASLYFFKRIIKRGLWGRMFERLKGALNGPVWRLV
jgi:hypothetical protein